MSNLFDIKMVFTQIPDLLTYLPVTLELAVVSMIVSLILGLILALIKMKKIPVLKQLANLYISVIRGTPVLVQLYVTYFGIPMILKAINLKYGTNYNANGVAPIIYAFIALAVNESAYNAEVIRASLESVPKGQIEAANALGMTYFQALRRVILPEAIVVALPSLGNSFIGLIKGTSLAFVCAVVEMTAAGKIIAGRTYRYFEVYVSLAIIYWIITIIVEQGIKVYLNADPDYQGRFTVPALVDLKTKKVVNNDYFHLTSYFETAWKKYHKPGAPDLYPEELREEIDTLNDIIFREVNNGVYKAGFARNQEAYEEAYHMVFNRLDWLEERLADRRYLFGDKITESDVRLYVTMSRFDVAYHNIFRVNKKRLRDYDNLWAYARDLYQTPGFGDTTDFAAIKKHYHIDCNPGNIHQIIAKGPDEEAWLLPHGREKLSEK